MKNPRIHADLPTRQILIKGKIPAKKNRSMGGGVYIDKELRARLDEITWQMKDQWGVDRPRSCPHIRFDIEVQNDRADSDNMVTTLLDCMQKAGIIVNDNTKHLRFWMVNVYDAIRDEDARVAITISAGVEA